MTIVRPIFTIGHLRWTLVSLLQRTSRPYQQKSPPTLWKSVERDFECGRKGLDGVFAFQSHFSTLTSKSDMLIDFLKYHCEFIMSVDISTSIHKWLQYF
jgi:hypothetical protein